MWVDFWPGLINAPLRTLYIRIVVELCHSWTLSFLDTASIVDQRNLLSGCRVDRYRLQAISGGIFTPPLHNTTPLCLAMKELVRLCDIR